MSTTVPAGLQTQGYYGTTPTPSAVPTAPVPTVVNVQAPSYYPQDTSAVTVGNSQLPTTSIGGNAILPRKIATVVDTAAKTIPAGTEAAVGAASAMVGASRVAKIVGDGAEPLFKLSWGIVADVADTVGAAVTLRFSDVIRGVGKVIGDGFVNTGSLLKKLTQPFTLTAAARGGTKMGLGGAVGVGLSTGLKALKSSFIWAIPASAVNTFIDYKYKDQTDPKRLLSNFAADCIGYTATGMAGAAVGAAVGSMTVPIVGTLVGAGVGILLGMAHDKITRPLISDTIRDQLG